MNKREAMLFLESGRPVSHRTFLKGEYIRLSPDGDAYVDESGNEMNPAEFWRFRVKPIFEEDWVEYVPDLKDMQGLKYERSTNTIRTVPGNHWVCSIDSWDKAIDPVLIAIQMVDAFNKVREGSK